MSNKDLTTEEIKHIASLAKLEFSAQEIERFRGEFNNILKYVSQIEECDTTGIDFEHNLSEYKGEVLQEDVVRAGLEKDEALMNATDGRSKAGLIVTSKIISKE